MVTVWTYNLKDYLRHDSAAERARHRLVELVIRDGQPDVIAVQELPGHSLARAEDALLRLASATGMVCQLGQNYDGPVAVVPGGHDDLALGLMWRESIWADPDGLAAFTGPQWWQGLLLVELHIDGRRLWHGSYHAAPKAGGLRRREEAALIVAAMAGKTGVIGGDFNNPYYYLDRAATRLATASQCGKESFRHDMVNQSTAGLLHAGGLYDAAVTLQTPRFLHDRALAGRPLRAAAHRRGAADEQVELCRATPGLHRHRVGPRCLRPFANWRGV